MLLEIPFRGLAARENANRTPFDRAMTCTDCYTDTDAVVGRAGYRSVLSGAVAGSGLFQHSGRFRPSASIARTVVVIAGEVFIVTDPSSETASDGVGTSLGTPFGVTALVSGVQLGTSYYLVSDEASVAMRRITWTSPSTFALESLEAIPAPDRPVGAVTTTLSWSLFSALTPTVSGCVVQTSASTGFTNMDSAWRGFAATNNGNDDPASGASAIYDRGSAFDATAYDWLAVTVTPHDEGGSAGNRRVTVQLSDDNSTWYSVGSIWDVPPTAGSPNLLFCDLRNLLSTVRDGLRYIKFLVEGTSGGRFAVYGYMFLPTMFRPNPPNVYVDFFNSSTGQMSALSAAARTSGGQVLTVSQGIPAAYPDTYAANDTIKKSGSSLDMFNPTNPRVFNRAAGVAMPNAADIGGTIAVSGTTSAYSGTLTVRLWADLSNGRRLISSVDKAASTAYSFTVGYSDALLSNQLYKPGGVGPRANALASHAQRLIATYQNRDYISSYVPTTQEKNAGGGVSVNPFPQWPDIATESADGWSFDYAPSPREQGLVLDGDGDAVYECSTEACYALTDLRPNSLPYLVFRRGAVGRHAAIFAEDRWFWAAWDGVYMAAGKSEVSELTRDVRRLYTETFLPDSNTCLGYNYRERALYGFTDTRYIRYSFVTNDWSSGTVAHNIRKVVSWKDAGSDPQMWVFTSDRKVGRWQDSASRDMQVGTDATTGTAIPDWVYSTGFDKTEVPQTVKTIMVDADGPVMVTAAKTAGGRTPDQARTREFVPPSDVDEKEREGWADFRGLKMRVEFTAPNATTLRYAAWSRGGLPGTKGG